MNSHTVKISFNSLFQPSLCSLTNSVNEQMFVGSWMLPCRPSAGWVVGTCVPEAGTCFSLLQDGVSFEVRRYDPAKYATVSSEGRTFDQISGELVRKLLMYIGGSNEQGKPGRSLMYQSSLPFLMPFKGHVAGISESGDTALTSCYI